MVLYCILIRFQPRQRFPTAMATAIEGPRIFGKYMGDGRDFPWNDKESLESRANMLKQAAAPDHKVFCG